MALLHEKESLLGGELRAPHPYVVIVDRAVRLRKLTGLEDT